MLDGDLMYNKSFGMCDADFSATKKKNVEIRVLRADRMPLRGTLRNEQGHL